MYAINPSIGYGLNRPESRHQREVDANATVRSVPRKSAAILTSRPPARLKSFQDKALFAAVESNDVKALTRALRRGADPNACRGESL